MRLQTMDAALLSVDQLEVRFNAKRGAVRPVDRVSFQMRAGERLAVVGESGSGKSTLALSLLRVLPRAGEIVGGRVLLRGRHTLQLSEDELRAVRGKEV